MSKPRLWNDDQLREAVSSSRSIRETLGKLGLAKQGGNYTTINRAVKRLNLDTSHWTGQAWNTGMQVGPKRNLEVYLRNEFPIKSHPLRKRLIAEGIFNHQCAVCKHTEWNTLPIPLELEHIDGNSDNNNLANLKLLCPNCHAQTSTYRGKNIKR